MNKLYVVMLAVLFATMAFAQNAEVVVDTAGVVPVVKVTSPAFEGMCKSFVEKLGGANGSEKISFEPPSGTPSYENVVETWTISNGLKEVRVKASELPILKKLHGATARNIMLGSCYLRSNYFFRTSDIVLVTMSDKDAEEVAAALR